MKKNNEKKVIINLSIVYAYSHKIDTYNLETNLINNININLNDLINQVASKIDFQGKIISLYDTDLKLFIYCGKFPLEKEFIFEYNKDEIIQIKLRDIISKLLYINTELLEDENEINDSKTNNIFISSKSKRAKERKIGEIIKKVYMWRKLYIGYKDENETDDNNTNNIFISSKSKRAKERKIGEIIKKVYMWRKLYIGYINENGKLIKLSLEDSADKIGISKKSLDDYLIQLRIGKMFGFNFNEHKNDKVGILRAFVKKKKPLMENTKYDSFDNIF